jgi:two-component system response regulator YesN
MQYLGVVLFSREEIESIEKAILYVRENSDKNINDEDLAELFTLDHRKIRVGFKRKTGLTVHKYLLQARIEKGKLLLAEPDYLIKKIARVIGFRNQSHFGKIFKQLTGITPQEYRFEHTNYMDSFRIS